MQGYDILMLGVMVIAIFRGYSKGLAWQVSSIASIVLSYFVAYRFKNQVTPMIELPDPWRGMVAMMALFVATSLVIWLISQSIRGAIEKAKLKDFDQQLGAIFGGVKGAAWCTVITLVALTFMSQSMSDQIVNSRSGGYIARLLASSRRIVPGEVQQVVQPYIQRAEARLQNRVEPAAPTFGQPFLQDPTFQNPGFQSPGYQSPGYQSPGYQSPGYQSPGVQSPGYQDPWGQLPSAPQSGTPHQFPQSSSWNRQSGKDPLTEFSTNNSGWK